MDLTLQSLLRAARDTVQDPREGARRIIALDLPIGARWSALALMAVASAILGYLSLQLSPAETRAYLGPAMGEPLRTAIIEGALLVFGVVMIHRLGAVRGGTGGFADALSLMAWLQFILLVLQVAQLVAQVLLPPLAGIIGVLSVGVFLWLLTHFVAELHGFRSLGATFLGVVGGLAVLFIVLALMIGAIIPIPSGV